MNLPGGFPRAFQSRSFYAARQIRSTTEPLNVRIRTGIV